VDPVVLVPLKRLARAKTRLLLPPDLRRELVLAMVADVLAATAAVVEVVLVSAEPAATELGVRVLPDSGRGLDGAVRAAAAGFERPVAVLAGDLPALRPAELAAALAAAGRHARALVADTPGTGTVLLMAARGRALLPSYGEGSRARHAASGAADLTRALGVDVAGLRRDVDTLADLEEAAALGVGPATARLLPAVRARSAA